MSVACNEQRCKGRCPLLLHPRCLLSPSQLRLRASFLAALEHLGSHLAGEFTDLCEGSFLHLLVLLLDLVEAALLRLVEGVAAVGPHLRRGLSFSDRLLLVESHVHDRHSSPGWRVRPAAGRMVQLVALRFQFER